MSTELERGDILFVYRLRIGIRKLSSLEDVQRFFFLLHPDGAARLREVIVPAKRLPDVQTRERAWAFVAQVTDRAAYFREAVKQRTYQTETHGERPPPRAWLRRRWRPGFRTGFAPGLGLEGSPRWTPPSGSTTRVSSSW